MAALPVTLAVAVSTTSAPDSKPTMAVRATLRPGLYSAAVPAHVVGQGLEIPFLAGRPDERVRGGEAIQCSAEIREAYGAVDKDHARSEEHTSELQSQSN